jgi:hypothetical protein
VLVPKRVDMNNNNTGPTQTYWAMTSYKSNEVDEDRRLLALLAFFPPS